MPASKDGSKQYGTGNRSIESDVATHVDVMFSTSGLLSERPLASARPERVPGSFLMKTLIDPSGASGQAAALTV